MTPGRIKQENQQVQNEVQILLQQQFMYYFHTVLIIYFIRVKFIRVFKKTIILSQFAELTAVLQTCI
jgi:hypothetical protein